ncbi:MAG: sigma-54-dependent Fis family transcriptional regulator [Deltaproteobacteria bacterium]|nr:sigma-54-dependent Fis family transcriptional regulator [Deltaproteobacteria bacterium]
MRDRQPLPAAPAPAAPRPLPAPLSREQTALSGRSAAMRALSDRVDRFAPSSLPALVLGETGVGKELCARALHERSPWAAGPFVAVNCAAIPRDLVSAELFGCTQGAFTGAQQRLGLISSAHLGTLFLDELGELPLDAQAALLRALERREVCPVGGVTPRPVQFRLVSATHRDLADMVRLGRFRADLYHRVSTLTLEVPPLRARLADLSDLVRELSASVAGRLTRDAWLALRAYPWPGNVRELRNLLARVELSHPEGPVSPVQLELAPPPPPPRVSPAAGSFLPSAADPRAHAVGAGAQELAEVIDELTLKELITLQVLRAVERHNGVSGAARALEVSRGTIYRYLDLALSRHLGPEERAARFDEPSGAPTLAPGAVAPEEELLDPPGAPAA